jgi:hypothetical protein
MQQLSHIVGPPFASTMKKKDHRSRFGRGIDKWQQQAKMPLLTRHRDCFINKDVHAGIGQTKAGSEKKSGKDWSNHAVTMEVNMADVLSHEERFFFRLLTCLADSLCGDN